MVDSYTKIVLTVIAAALVLSVVQNGIGRSKADFNPPGSLQKVQICDSLDCATVVKVGGVNSLAVVPR